MTWKIAQPFLSGPLVFELYLVDTNVISAGAPSRAPAVALVDWMLAHSEQLFMSVITISEIEDGIAKSIRQGAVRRADDLSAWLQTLTHLYGKRILLFDIPVAKCAGALCDVARSNGQSPGYADLIIAATGHYHGLTILTRNLRHFIPLGVAAQDPFLHVPTDKDA